MTRDNQCFLPQILSFFNLFSQGCLEKFPSIFSVKDHLKTCEKAVSHKCLACGKVFTGWIVAQNHVKYWHVAYTVTAFLYSREVLNNIEF